MDDSAFIIISLCERLHSIVDGIVACRPRNADIQTKIFTGKIIDDDDGYTYQYTTPGTGASKSAKNWTELLANQLATFRTECKLQANDMVNIFVLDNPRTDEELTQSEDWCEGFDEVYNSFDKNFTVHRILFAYDTEEPECVSSRTTRDIQKRILDTYDTASDNSTYQSFLFYIGNQDCTGNAICTDKDGHDMMIERFLADFMMLLSNHGNNYNVFNSIITSQANQCYSVGYAECMYYYPDVERYFMLANKCRLYDRCLNDDDDTEGMCSDYDAMSAEQHPFGLNARLERMGKRYEDVPYTQDISIYPDENADKQTDDIIVSLKDIIQAEYSKERNDYQDECKRKDELVESCKREYDSATKREEETEKDFADRKSKLQSSLDNAKRERANLTFSPKCPGYIDRGQIFQGNGSKKDVDKYEKLIKYLTEEQDQFVSFSFSCMPATDAANVEEGLAEKRGCMSWLFFWKKDKEDEATPTEESGNENGQKAGVIDVKDAIDKIKELISLKDKYRHYKEEVKDVQRKEKEGEQADNKFELTKHAKSISSLIDIDRLRQEQAKSGLVDNRLQGWKNEAGITLSKLLEKTKDETADYAKKTYSSINWEKPFSFVRKDSEFLTDVCNEMQKISAPLANYNKVSTQKVSDYTTYFYSDYYDPDGNFSNLGKKMKEGGKLCNANEIGFVDSSHIESKVAIMNFLPMTSDILNTLTVLASGRSADEDSHDSSTYQQPNQEQENDTTDTDEPEEIDWGTH